MIVIHMTLKFQTICTLMNNHSHMIQKTHAQNVVLGLQTHTAPKKERLRKFIVESSYY
jgi:hypothetical protein